MFDAKGGGENVFPIPAETVPIVICTWLSFLLPTVYFFYVINLCVFGKGSKRSMELKRLHHGDRVRGGSSGKEREEGRLKARNLQKRQRLHRRLAGQGESDPEPIIVGITLWIFSFRSRPDTWLYSWTV